MSRLLPFIKNGGLIKTFERWIDAVRYVGRGIAVCLLVMVCVVGAPAVAFAEDDENLVDPQQRPDSSFIYDTSISALGEADSYYDNQTVQVVGEAIGDKINGGGSSHQRWVTLAASEKNSTATAAVIMSYEAAAKIDTFGRYGTTGTMLQVRGIFHLVCPDHEGLTDLHAEAVSVVAKGKHHADVFDLGSFIPGLIAVGAGIIIMGVFYYLRERQR